MTTVMPGTARRKEIKALTAQPSTSDVVHDEAADRCKSCIIVTLAEPHANHLRIIGAPVFVQLPSEGLQ